MADGERDEAKARVGWDIVPLDWLRNPPRLLASFVVSVAIVLLALFGVLTATVLWRVFMSLGGGADELNKLLIALAGLVGAPFVVWRVLIAAHTNQIAQDTAKENSRVAQENLYTGLLTKAVEQLGATREEKTTRETVDKDGVAKFETKTETVPNTEVRLGAIYALEKLARDYEPLHWPIMEILCAYVRKNAGKPKQLPDEIRAIYAKRWVLRSFEDRKMLENRGKELGAPFVDVQAALTVIGRRGELRRHLESKLRAETQAGQDYRLDLTGCHLAGAKFDGLHFSQANFDGASLEGAALLNAHLEGASFRHARLEGAWLRKANLEGAPLFQARLEGASLDEANLKGASLDWTHLEGASLDRAHLESASLDGAHLEGASLFRTYLKGAVLHQAFLDGALLIQAHLENALLVDAHLEGAMLSRAQIDGASFYKSDLHDTRIDGVDFQKALGLSGEALADAWGDRTTLLPSSVPRPQNERWALESLSDEEKDNRLRLWLARSDHWLAEAKRRAAAAPPPPPPSP